MNKKRMAIVSLFLLLLLISGCKKSLIDQKDIVEISLKPGDFLASEVKYFQKESSDTTDFAFITDTLETFLAQPIISGHQNYSDFTLNITYKDKKIRTFNLDLDLEAQKAYLIEGANTRVAEGELFAALINSPIFSPYLVSSFVQPTVTLQLGDRSFPTVSTGNFSIQWFSGSHITESTQSKASVVQMLQVNTALDPSITFSADRFPTEIIENIYQGSNLLSSSTLVDSNIILPEEEGPFEIELICRWKQISEHYFDGEAAYRFNINNDLPVEFNMQNTTALPGNCLVLTAKYVNEDQTLSASAPFLKKEVTFIPYNNYFIAILPLFSYVEPDTYTLTATATNGNGATVTKDFSVEVDYKEFDVQYLTVSASTYALQSQENIDSDTAYLLEARSAITPEKLWDGAFLQPVEGVITTEYAQTRYTNDNPVPSRHSGIDLAAPKGTPVMASNNGIVTMAMTLYLTGNTVVLDHGMGIFTAYCHLDEMGVAKGDTLKKGDIVGKIGTTGFSTGPHLHFTVYINGTYVNPWTFFESDLLDF